jgi:hypothetical protein
MNPLIIHTEGAGRLANDCDIDYVKQVVAAVADSQHTVIHLHGGLVREPTAREMVKRLDPYYCNAGLLPVFFVWETGFLETIRNNLQRIAGEEIFKSLVCRLLRHVAGKVLLDEPGSRSVTNECMLPTPIDVQIELQKITAGNEPYGDIATGDVADLTPEEEVRLQRELERDPYFEIAVAGVLAGLQVEPPVGAKSPSVNVLPVETLMSKHITKELRDEAQKPGGKGLLETAVLIKRAVTVLLRVIKRFNAKRDHGIYTTIVEEVLRELYLDSIGSLIWGSMKNDARDNFSAPGDGKMSGGYLLMTELASALNARAKAGAPIPKISIVGHSAGTIFACELLRHIVASQEALSLHRLVFLAAACRCDLFEPILQSHAKHPLWDDFRSYSLCDDLEKGYWEVPLLYPRSLLYLVSGLVETEGYKAAFDMPLVGMERFINWNHIYNTPDVIGVRSYVHGSPTRQIWSESNAGDGLNSDAIRHGGLDDTDGKHQSTMHSVIHFLTH